MNLTTSDIMETPLSAMTNEDKAVATKKEEEDRIYPIPIAPPNSPAVAENIHHIPTDENENEKMKQIEQRQQEDKLLPPPPPQPSSPMPFLLLSEEEEISENHLKDNNSSPEIASSMSSLRSEKVVTQDNLENDEIPPYQQQRRVAVVEEIKSSPPSSSSSASSQEVDDDFEDDTASSLFQQIQDLRELLNRTDERVRVLETIGSIGRRRVWSHQEGTKRRRTVGLPQPTRPLHPSLSSLPRRNY